MYRIRTPAGEVCDTNLEVPLNLTATGEPHRCRFKHLEADRGAHMTYHAIFFY